MVEFGELNEAEAAAVSGVDVDHDLGVGHRPDAAECLAQAGVVDVHRKVRHVEIRGVRGIRVLSSTFVCWDERERERESVVVDFLTVERGSCRDGRGGRTAH